MKLKEDGKAINFLLQPDIYNELKKESEQRYLSLGALLRMILAERYFHDSINNYEKK